MRGQGRKAPEKREVRRWDLKGGNESRLKYVHACPEKNNKKGHLFLVSLRLSSSARLSPAQIASVSSEFDIFAHRPIQTAVLGTIEGAIKRIATVEPNDLELFTCR